MQTKNPLLDDLANLMTGAMGAAQGVGDEMQAVFRAQIDRIVADMDLVKREEFEAMKTLAQEASARVGELEARLASLEGEKNKS